MQEVKVANIKTRVNTGRSLMPEGFEGLGGEMLRDIIAYMQSVDGGKFRALDLARAFTANTARGLYISEANTSDTLEVRARPATSWWTACRSTSSRRNARPRTSCVNCEAARSARLPKSMPERVEVPVGGFTANRLHFLGGVAGWGYPFGSEGEVVMRVTVHSSDGQRETFN